VQRTIELVLAHFVSLGSCQKVLRRLRDKGLRLPVDRPAPLGRRDPLEASKRGSYLCDPAQSGLCRRLRRRALSPRSGFSAGSGGASGPPAVDRVGRHPTERLSVLVDCPGKSDRKESFR
jgi:hypothetical protein